MWAVRVEGQGLLKGQQTCVGFPFSVEIIDSSFEHLLVESNGRSVLSRINSISLDLNHFWWFRYLRELQNQARADHMNTIALAKAEQHGWRPLNQYAMSSAILVTKQDSSWGLAQEHYMYVVQHIAHYLPMTMRGEG